MENYIFGKSLTVWLADLHMKNEKIWEEAYRLEKF